MKILNWWLLENINFDNLNLLNVHKVFECEDLLILYLTLNIEGVCEGQSINAINIQFNDESSTFAQVRSLKFTIFAEFWFWLSFSLQKG